jgi:hypothetical protein
MGNQYFQKLRDRLKCKTPYGITSSVKKKVSYGKVACEGKSVP